MPDYMSYGDILRSERELAGYDVTSMAKRLHIRPDILVAIENGDFDRMPALGYTKNMIRAYARALRIDERMITDLYLEEANDYELGFINVQSRQRDRQGSNRGRSQRRDSSMRLSRSSGDERSRSERLPRSSRSSSIGLDAPERERDRGRDYDRRATRGRASERDAGRRSDRGRREEAQSQQLRGRSSKQKAARAVGAIGSVVPSFGARGRQDARMQQPLSTVGANPPYARGAQERNGIANMNLTMLLAIVAVAIIIIILIVVFVNSTKRANEEVPSIPISGLTDTSSPEDQNQVSTAQVAPKDVQVIYYVNDGQSAWMEVYLNGSDTPEFSEVVDGPQSQTYNVTDTIKIRTANPDGVTVTSNGEPVTLTRESGTSYYSYSVDFADILREWQANNAQPAPAPDPASPAPNA